MLLNAASTIRAKKFLDTHFTKAVNADNIYNAAMKVYGDEKIAKSYVKKHESANAP